MGSRLYQQAYLVLLLFTGKTYNRNGLLAQIVWLRFKVVPIKMLVIFSQSHVPGRRRFDQTASAKVEKKRRRPSAILLYKNCYGLRDEPLPPDVPFPLPDPAAGFPLVPLTPVPLPVVPVTVPPPFPLGTAPLPARELLEVPPVPEPAPVPASPLSPVPLPVEPVTVPSPIPVPLPVAVCPIVLSVLPAVADPTLESLPIVPVLFVEVLSDMVVLFSSAPLLALPPHDANAINKAPAKIAFFMV
jgi:hypothetical protein